jgi:hypothetical protein
VALSLSLIAMALPPPNTWTPALDRGGEREQEKGERERKPRGDGKGVPGRKHGRDLVVSRRGVVGGWRSKRNSATAWIHR